jgi:hypothetical protein
MRVVALENEYVTVACNPETGIVEHVTHRFLVSEVFRQALLAGLELMRAHGATKWLSDERLNGAISNEDVEWGAAVWRPRAVALGLTCWALVLPRSTFGSARARRIVEEERSWGLPCEVFEEREAARRWLEQQPRAKPLRAPDGA